MKYPYEHIVQAETRDGGLTMMFHEMIFFALKVFVFCFVGYIALWCASAVIAKELNDRLPKECLTLLVK